MNVVKVITLLAICLFLGGAAPLNTVSYADFDMGTKNIAKKFNVTSGQKLVVDLEIGADIKIEGWDKDELIVDAKLTGDVENIEVDFEETSNGIRIYAEYTGWSDNNNGGGVFNIKVPSKFDVKFTTMGGDISLTGVEGDLGGQTMGGDMTLTKLTGELQLTTMGGDIELTDSDVDGRVKTMGGDVDVINVTGNVNAESMGGDIRQKNVKRRIGESVGEEVNISTMGGDIDVDEAPFGAKVKTMGGDVSINNAGKFVEVTTMGGDIVIRSVDGWVKAVTMGGDIEVKVIGDPLDDNKEVKLKSMNGDIKLYVPDGFSMNLDLDISFDRRHEDEVEIISDFDVEIERSGEWERENGNKRKHIYGTGEFNGGKNKINIKTTNGKIYLYKS